MTELPLFPRVRGIQDVAERHLCTGCGVCAFVQKAVIEMVDDVDAGRRPLVRDVDGRVPDTSAALAVCPGVELSHGDPVEGAIPELQEAWGPVLEVWEGYATDPEIRLAASSGGAATALALHCLANEGMHGVLHTAAREDVPYLNRTVLSTTRAELLAATGSRYAPASPCDGLQEVVDAPAPCVFVGKPCDVAGAQRARGMDPGLDDNLGLTIGIFCAGTPSVRGTLEMLAEMGIEDVELVRSIRYRGNGWPGDAVATVEPGTDERRMSYEESWGQILQRHRQWRCYVCADHTGEFADVAVGDPWYREIAPDEPGHSLVVVRTERGRKIVEAALEAGMLTLERVQPSLLPASQPNLLQVRGSVWGRIATMRVLGLPAPVLRGLPTLPAWWSALSARGKVQSVLGTVKRIFTKRLYRRRVVQPARLGKRDVARTADRRR